MKPIISWFRTTPALRIENTAGGADRLPLPGFPSSAPRSQTSPFSSLSGTQHQYTFFPVGGQNDPVGKDLENLRSRNLRADHDRQIIDDGHPRSGILLPDDAGQLPSGAIRADGARWREDSATGRRSGWRRGGAAAGGSTRMLGPVAAPARGLGDGRSSLGQGLRRRLGHCRHHLRVVDRNRVGRQGCPGEQGRYRRRRPGASGDPFRRPGMKQPAPCGDATQRQDHQTGRKKPMIPLPPGTPVDIQSQVDGEISPPNLLLLQLFQGLENRAHGFPPPAVCRFEVNRGLPFPAGGEASRKVIPPASSRTVLPFGFPPMSSKALRSNFKGPAPRPRRATKRPSAACRPSSPCQATRGCKGRWLAWAGILPRNQARSTWR